MYGATEQVLACTQLVSISAVSMDSSAALCCPKEFYCRALFPEVLGLELRLLAPYGIPPGLVGLLVRLYKQYLFKGYRARVVGVQIHLRELPSLSLVTGFVGFMWLPERFYLTRIAVVYRLGF